MQIPTPGQRSPQWYLKTHADFCHSVGNKLGSPEPIIFKAEQSSSRETTWKVRRDINCTMNSLPRKPRPCTRCLSVSHAGKLRRRAGRAQPVALSKPAPLGTGQTPFLPLLGPPTAESGPILQSEGYGYIPFPGMRRFPQYTSGHGPNPGLSMDLSAS